MGSIQDMGDGEAGEETMSIQHLRQNTQTSTPSNIGQWLLQDRAFAGVGHLMQPSSWSKLCVKKRNMYQVLHTSWLELNAILRGLMRTDAFLNR